MPDINPTFEYGQQSELVKDRMKIDEEIEMLESTGFVGEVATGAPMNILKRKR